MPTPSPQDIIDAQRRDWNRVAGGWDKWDDSFSRNMTCINHRLVADARLRQGQRVLDLGSGTGYPALLAGDVVGRDGAVVGIDLAESMLAVATRKAKALGLSHVTFRTGDVSMLPFDAASFDAVISRFCLMFLPNVSQSLQEIARVLKPGGYLAAAVWSTPDKNPFIRMPMDVIKTITPLPPPDPEAPGVFRLGKAGDLRTMVERAGLTPLGEEEFLSEVHYASAEEFLHSLMDVAAPVQNLMASFTTAQKTQAEEGIVRAANDYGREGAVVMPIAVRIVSARKPITKA